MNSRLNWNTAEEQQQPQQNRFGPGLKPPGSMVRSLITLAVKEKCPAPSHPCISFNQQPQGPAWTLLSRKVPFTTFPLLVGVPRLSRLPLPLPSAVLPQQGLYASDAGFCYFQHSCSMEPPQAPASLWKG